ncbi:unnamed protein product [Rangifer tarandus platyrhynchus]|uniref:Uncharacterized protein n=2 Tax=Rangifer tarandus platyrhynchus TaxID=3082113 RepID=A0ABN8ZH15_RANTA|nr:unnamed protein product [Rangifer tarandus platyrhynchus]
MDRGAWWAPVHGVTKSQTQLSTHACTALGQWAIGLPLWWGRSPQGRPGGGEAISQRGAAGATVKSEFGSYGGPSCSERQKDTIRKPSMGPSSTRLCLHFQSTPKHLEGFPGVGNDPLVSQRFLFPKWKCAPFLPSRTQRCSQVLPRNGEAFLE